MLRNYWNNTVLFNQKVNEEYDHDISCFHRPTRVGAATQREVVIILQLMTTHHT